MSDILIERNHALGIDRAREIARHWIDQAQHKYGMECLYTEGDAGDVAKFSRPGMEGRVEVTANTFTLHMTLGFLMATFKGAIEEKVTRNLDEFLAKQDNARA